MPERTYLDTSFLLKAYVQEADSADVVRYLHEQSGDIAVSPLIHVEIASTLFRRLPLAEAAASLAIYRHNCASGAFAIFEIVGDVYRRAEVLAQQYSASMRLRSLDLLHLATALQHGATSLASYDDNLRRASAACGLAIVPARP